MTIARVTCTWRGFRGAPGYTNLFFQAQNEELEDRDAMVDSATAFFNEFFTYLPGGVTIDISPTIDYLDETNGNLVGQADASEGYSVTGGSTASYSAASGAVVNWNTSSFANGRRIRGRTFLVPLASDSYDAQGDLTSAALTSIRTAANALATGLLPARLVVWSRPKNGAAGSVHTVTSATVPDLGAILRSRRD